MKKFTVKLALAFSIAIGGYGLILACSGVDWDYDSDTSFTPEAFVDKSYAPLFYSPNEVFYRIMFEDQYKRRFNSSVVADWASYLTGLFSKKQIEFLLLDEKATTTVGQLYSALKMNGKLPDEYAAINLTNGKVAGFVNFLHYAKAIEECSTADLSSWDYADKDKVKMVDPSIIAELEALYGPTSDVFLRNRYWFQIMKGYFYSANKPAVIAFFDKTKSTVQKNLLYYRGLAYVGGAYYSQKKYATSNYLFAQVFDARPELRTVATYNYHPLDDAGFRASLNTATTKGDKSALWALAGYYGDEKKSIREIYKIDPGNHNLDFLLTRLVNKEESKLNADHKVTTVAEYKQKVRSLLDTGSVNLVARIAQDGKTNNPYLWTLAAGYLTALSGDAARANDLLTKAGQGQSEMESKQVRLLKLINNVFSLTRMDSDAEAKLLNDLDWLYNTVNSSDQKFFRYHQALNWTKQYISALYNLQHDRAMAEAFNRSESYYREGANIEAMKAFLMNQKTPWQQLAAKIYDVTLSDIFEYQGQMAAYAGRLDVAIDYMQRSDKGQGVQLLGNPFNGKIQDCHDCEHEKVHLPVPYTKLTLLTKMKEMNDHVEKGEDVYNNALLLANAYYGLTYFGNSRRFYYGNIINQYGNSIDPYYQPYLLDCSRAKLLYQKAFDAATTDEQRAKCSYMLAKCERNDFYTKRYYSNSGFYGDTDVDYQAWDGFKKLRQNYAATKFYQDVIKECGYFKDWLGK